MNHRHRLARQEDLPSIVAIYNLAVLARSSTCDLQPVKVTDRLEWFESASPDRHPIWVSLAEDESETVTGYLSFEPFLNGRPGYDTTLDLAIYLHPAYRGRGLGHHLLGAAIAHAPRLGARTLATTIFASNEPSRRLFRSQGFADWGRLPGVAELEGVVHDVVVVGRRVGECPDAVRASALPTPRSFDCGLSAGGVVAPGEVAEDGHDADRAVEHRQ